MLRKLPTFSSTLKLRSYASTTVRVAVWLVTADLQGYPAVNFTMAVDNRPTGSALESWNTSSWSNVAIHLLSRTGSMMGGRPNDPELHIRDNVSSEGRCLQSQRCLPEHSMPDLRLGNRKVDL